MKNVIVTGGSRGIGAAIVTAFAKKGYNVIINYNKSFDAASTLSNSLNSLGYNTEIFKADVSDSKQVQSLIDFTINRFGSIDILVNNAGISEQKLFNDVIDFDWNTMIANNLSSCFYCCREASKHMINAKQGKIINISSMWGICGASLEVHYSASKAGIIGLTKSLAKELGPSNINVNCIAPGVILTDMCAALSEETLCNLKEETPINRLGTPEDVANAVLFLASDEASFITGQVLSVDGGFVI